MQIVRNTILTVLLAVLPLAVSAQQPASEADSVSTPVEVVEAMQQFMDEFGQLAIAANVQLRLSDNNRASGNYVRLLKEKVRITSSNLQSLEFRWNTFSQAEQTTIANNEKLMEQMTQISQLKQAVADTIAAQQKKCDAVTDFSAAERLILSQDSVYKRIYRQAVKLSMVKKTAPQLEKLKAQEQALFTRIDASYQKAKAATETVPELRRYVNAIDEHYYKLKAVSEKVQSMAYKPFFQRIKDYLLGLACVAIIMMFMNMLITKWSAAKKLRKTLKQQKALFERTSGNDYPTI